jgi:hypothetical protein
LTSSGRRNDDDQNRQSALWPKTRLESSQQLDDGSFIRPQLDTFLQRFSPTIQIGRKQQGTTASQVFEAKAMGLGAKIEHDQKPPGVTFSNVSHEMLVPW